MALLQRNNMVVSWKGKGMDEMGLSQRVCTLVDWLKSQGDSAEHILVKLISKSTACLIDIALLPNVKVTRGNEDLNHPLVEI